MASDGLDRIMLVAASAAPGMSVDVTMSMRNKRLAPPRDQNRRLRLSAAAVVTLLGSASCVPSARVAAVSSAAPDVQPIAAAPAAPPLAFQPIAAEAAMAANAAIPVADIANPPARAFTLGTRGFVHKLRSVDCLTSAIYYEAASESDDGQRAVAQVVLNRVRHPSYPNSVCGVVYQGSERTTGCQFTFTCDGSLARTPSLAGWARARRIAAEALAGRVFAPVGHSTHYHTHQVLPYWASSLVKSAVIGAHIFYRWNGVWGKPAAFRQPYAGVEPLPGPKPRPAVLPLPAVALLQADLAAIRAPAPAQPASAAWAPVRTVDEPVASGTPLPTPAADDRLPTSQVREEYRYSGVPLDELPGARKAAAAAR